MEAPGRVGIQVPTPTQMCAPCNGEGTIIRAGQRCAPCRGKKVMQVKKELEVHIDPGMKHGERIVFKGEGDQAPGTVPGDVVIVLQQREHDDFSRKGADLIMSRTISLADALCGFEMVVEHLDGRRVLIKQVGGADIIKPNSVTAIADEGMPVHRNPFEKGRLFVQWKVDFPSAGALTAKQASALASLLGGKSPAPKYDEADVELARMVEIEDPQREFGATSSAARDGNAYQEDDEHDQMGGGGASCAQQ